ncbi:sporulation protein YqfC [Aquisalibacillus elongatus]|uniref:Sporulation protein YqfC n=1 Tax=Aquisalibacillus elongatus TaxID=485577 RepID=A0A3N5BDN2_9BACI|nr:sporulation protein YqfC [Aquisalibacillus elongatus]RPF55593.1 sporulation protein YqfC [Aquisalibacillus elongatus]
MKPVRKRINQWLTGQLQLPADIIYDYPRITLIGDIHLYIENHEGLLTFESNLIEVRQHLGVLRIEGEKMVIKNLLKKEIVIEGNIHAIYQKYSNKTGGENH